MQMIKSNSLFMHYIYIYKDISKRIYFYSIKFDSIWILPDFGARLTTVLNNNKSVIGFMIWTINIFFHKMPRDDVQLQFLLGSSVRRPKKDGKSRKGGSRNIRPKGSIQSDTRSMPQSPMQQRSPLQITKGLSHTSTLEDLRISSIQLDARFLSNPRLGSRHDTPIRQNKSSSNLIR